MNESGRRVALVGEPLGLEAAVTDAGGEVVSRDAADVIVTVGEAALIETAVAVPGAAVLPIAADAGHYVVPKPRASVAVEKATAGAGRVVDHPVLDVEVDGRSAGRAAFDVDLFTSEPAKISEYAVEYADETLDSVRADGVVVATPLGSEGYARAVGGPVLLPGSGLVVTPVSPFTTDPTDWVVPDDLTVTVERDETPVGLSIDGTEWGAVSASEPVRVTTRTAVSVLQLLGETGPT